MDSHGRTSIISYIKDACTFVTVSCYLLCFLVISAHVHDLIAFLPQNVQHTVIP